MFERKGCNTTVWLVWFDTIAGPLYTAVSHLFVKHVEYIIDGCGLKSGGDITCQQSRKSIKPYDPIINPQTHPRSTSPYTYNTTTTAPWVLPDNVSSLRVLLCRNSRQSYACATSVISVIHPISALHSDLGTFAKSITALGFCMDVNVMVVPD